MVRLARLIVSIYVGLDLFERQAPSRLATRLGFSVRVLQLCVGSNLPVHSLLIVLIHDCFWYRWRSHNYFLALPYGLLDNFTWLSFLDGLLFRTVSLGRIQPHFGLPCLLTSFLGVYRKFIS